MSESDDIRRRCREAVETIDRMVVRVYAPRPRVRRLRLGRLALSWERKR